jgi:hypothetical protein
LIHVKGDLLIELNELVKICFESFGILVFDDCWFALFFIYLDSWPWKVISVLKKKKYLAEVK